jgi:hypothetical protein
VVRPIGRWSGIEALLDRLRQDPAIRPLQRPTNASQAPRRLETVATILPGPSSQEPLIAASSVALASAIESIDLRQEAPPPPSGPVLSGRGTFRGLGARGAIVIAASGERTGSRPMGSAAGEDLRVFRSRRLLRGGKLFNQHASFGMY